MKGDSDERSRFISNSDQTPPGRVKVLCRLYSDCNSVGCRVERQTKLTGGIYPALSVSLTLNLSSMHLTTLGHHRGREVHCKKNKYMYINTDVAFNQVSVCCNLVYVYLAGTER